MLETAFEDPERNLSSAPSGRLFRFVGPVDRGQLGHKISRWPSAASMFHAPPASGQLCITPPATGW